MLTTEEHQPGESYIFHLFLEEEDNFAAVGGTLRVMPFNMEVEPAYITKVI